jgi:hypothetical protein
MCHHHRAFMPRIQGWFTVNKTHHISGINAKTTHYLNRLKKKLIKHSVRTVGMAHVVEHLFSKSEAEFQPQYHKK